MRGRQIFLVSSGRNIFNEERITFNIKRFKEKRKSFLFRKYSLPGFLASFLSFNQQAYAMELEQYPKNAFLIVRNGLLVQKKHWKDIANNPSLASLKLFNSYIQDRRIKAFILGHFSSLTYLNLKGIKLGVVGVKFLRFSGNLSSITCLDLYKTLIKPRGTEYLAFSNLPALTSLDLGNNKIGPVGAKWLSLAPFSSSLRSLNLDGNFIGDVGARWLSYAPFSSLTRLDLGNNKIGPLGARCLSLALFSSSLTALNLVNNKIGPIGARCLSLAPFSSSLRSLNLDGNLIGDEGARWLSHASSSSLTQLDLRNNKIGPVGARWLSLAPFSSLTSLSLDGNPIEMKGRAFCPLPLSPPTSQR